MTPSEKKRITEMRIDRKPYLTVAQEIGLPLNTVKTFCRRNRLLDKDVRTASLCRNCGTPITRGRTRPRLFCSDACRMSWWHAHPEKIERRAVYTFTCQACGIGFEAYGNNHRKYCSRACYQKARAARLNV